MTAANIALQVAICAMLSGLVYMVLELRDTMAAEKAMKDHKAKYTEVLAFAPRISDEEIYNLIPSARPLGSKLSTLVHIDQDAFVAPAAPAAPATSKAKHYSGDCPRCGGNGFPRTCPDNGACYECGATGH